MRKVLALLLIFTVIVPLPAFADDVALPELDIRKFQLEDITYVGFLEKDAQTLLQYRIDVPKLKLKITTLEAKITNKALQIDTLTSANNICLEAKEFLTVENVRMQHDKDTRDSWYRSPYFWFSVGLLLGTAATVTVVYLVK